MAGVDKNLEKLIVRHLDGELSEDEQLELNRELIRDPEAHRMMEAYRRLDELASAALHQALDDDRLPLDPAALPDRSVPRTVRSYHRGWWLVPGAIAAALLAVAVARFQVAPSSTPSMADGQRNVSNHVAPLERSPQSDRFMRTVGTNPPSRRIRRETGREVFGVVGDDGNVYWIEVDRVRTLRQPRPGSAARSTAEHM